MIWTNLTLRYDVAIMGDVLSLSVGGLIERGRIRSWCVEGLEGNV